MLISYRASDTAQHNTTFDLNDGAPRCFGIKLTADFLNAVCFRRGLASTPGSTNALIDGGQPKAKLHLRKVKSNHVLKTVFSCCQLPVCNRFSIVSPCLQHLKRFLARSSEEVVFYNILESMSFSSTPSFLPSESQHPASPLDKLSSSSMVG